MMEPLVEMRIDPPPEIMELEENINQKLSSLSEKHNLDIEDTSFLFSLKTIGYHISQVPKNKRNELKEIMNLDIIRNYFFDSQRGYVHDGIANPTLTKGPIDSPSPVEGDCDYYLRALKEKDKEKIEKGDFNGEATLMMCGHKDEERVNLFYLPPQGILGRSGGKLDSIVKGESDYVQNHCKHIDDFCPLSKIKTVYEIKDLDKVVDFVEEDLKKDLSKKTRKELEEGLEGVKDYFVKEMKEIDESLGLDENNVMNTFQGYMPPSSDEGVRSGVEVA